MLRFEINKDDKFIYLSKSLGWPRVLVERYGSTVIDVVNSIINDDSYNGVDMDYVLRYIEDEDYLMLRFTIYKFNSVNIFFSDSYSNGC